MQQVPLQRFEVLPTNFSRYRVVKLLGQGGMGAVYLAQDMQLDRPVALKIPTFSGNDGPMVLERFQREARAAATILHPNVCPLYDVGEIDGVPYLTMGYIDGKPLAAYVAARPQPPRQSAFLVRKLALALAEAHKRGVIHRDLKPANVMIDKRSEPIIMDFGLARRARSGDARLTQMGSMMGTPAYMPPEQVSGDVNLMGPGCDIYSLGVILYELLAGRLPFTGDAMAMLSQVLLDDPPPPSKFRPDLDPELEAICLKAMAKKIPDRHASMTELATALQDYLRGKPQATEPAAPARNASKATLVPGTRAADLVEAEAETLRPEKNARAPDTMPVVAPIADSHPTARTSRKTRRPRRKSRGRGGVPLWAWIAAGVGSAVVLVLALLLILSRKPPVKSPDQPLPPKPVAPRPHDNGPDKTFAGLDNGQFNLPNITARGLITVSADGKLLAAACGNNLYLFDAHTGESRGVLTGHTDSVSAGVFTLDNTRIITTSRDHTIRVWDANTHQEQLVLRRHTGPVFYGSLSADGKRYASSSADGTVLVWDTDFKQGPLVLRGHAAGVGPTTFSPDGKWVVSGSNDRTVRVWNAKTGTVHRVLPGHSLRVLSVAFSPDGKTLATGSNAELKLYHGDTFKEIRTTREPAGWLAFTPNGQSLWTAKHDHDPGEGYLVTRWDVSTAKSMAKFPLKSQGGWGFYCLSPDGKTLFAYANSDPFVGAYDTQSGAERFPRHAPASQIGGGFGGAKGLGAGGGFGGGFNGGGGFGGGINKPRP